MSHHHSQPVVMFGQDLDGAPDLPLALSAAADANAEFICVPLTPEAAASDEGSQGDSDRPSRPPPPLRSAMALSSHEWTTAVVGKVSSKIDLDSADPAERKAAEEQFKAELSWASHLGLPAIAVPLSSDRCVNLASSLNAILAAPLHCRVWVRVPTCPPGSGDEDAEDEADTWFWWDRLRKLCKPTVRLSVGLELTANLPSAGQLARWLGEPVRCVFINTSVFLTNAKGFPVLSKPHQAFFKSLLRLKPQVVVSGQPQHEEGTTSYIRYLQFLHSSVIEDDPVKLFAHGYEDYLQSPLQPLMDNLESATYETFEKDPIKYAQYQEAVRQALVDRVPEADAEKTTSVIMVVGAGRGPIVQACLDAAEEAQRKVRVYAVDKNTNAFYTLQARNVSEWDRKVVVVNSDMRDWDAPEKADILVSELLGSFGDNELSPECLDGAQKYLKADGISVPSKYTSYLAPVSSYKIYADLVSHGEADRLETPFVVLLHNVYVMSGVQPCFVFDHPTVENPDNSRYGSFKFPVAETCTMHGLAGYFDAVLYKDVMISIHPQTHSRGMFSWFPIFFPLAKPMLVPAGSTVEAHMWRKVSPRKVWYEWAVVQPEVSKIHNAGGAAYAIGL